MKRLKGKMGKDTRGFSIVELICAVAILGAISTAIAGAMVVTANSYKNGTTEVGLQKETQFTANVIEGLLVDATDSVDYYAASKTLVIKNTDYTHTISLDTATKALNYSCTDTITGAAVPNGTSVLAENVTDFVADTSDFTKSRNAQITIKMMKDDREIATVYNVTSRNNPTSSTAVTYSQTATLSLLSEVTLEPNQTDFEVNVTVNTSGGAIPGFNCSLITEDDPASKAVADGSVIKITVGANEKGGADGKLMVVVNTNAVDPVTGLPYDSRTLVVNVRRVTGFDMPSPTLISGNAMKQDAIYQVTATPTGTSLDRVLGRDYDNDYVNPYGATWEFTMSTGEAWTDYVEVLSQEENVSPYVRFKLKKDIAVGDGLTITASSKHSRGNVGGVNTNKTGLYYDTVTASKTLKTGNFYLAGDFLRGDDFVNLIELINWGDIKNQYGGDRVWRSIRYCPAKLDSQGEIVALTGTWSDWINFTSGDTPGFAPIRPNDLNLNPSLSYAMEVRLQYGTHSGTITWPKSDTPEAEYMFRFTVPAASVIFNYYYNDGNLITFPYGTDGIEYDDRLILRRDTLYTFNVTGDAGHVAKFFDSHMRYKLQRQTDSGWVDASTEWGFMYPDGMKLKAPGTVGVYRLELKWDESWYTSNYGTLIPYADESTGKGFIYFEVRN
jgi:prepilin-type N-terminal cleavage/methylation domain-containing protein